MIGSRRRLLNTSTEDSLKLEIGGREVKQVSSTKSLGVIIDENLCWNEQVDGISTKVSKAIGMIRRAKHYANSDVIKCIRA